MTSQIDVTMALYAEHWTAMTQPSTQTPNILLHQALCLKNGELSLNDVEYSTGDGFYLPDNAQLRTSENTEVAALRFVFIATSLDAETLNDQLSVSTNSSAPHRKLIAHRTFSTNLEEAVLRLDRIDFPPGAIAYRHTHPGGGFRYLTQGTLKLHSDHEVQDISPDEAWFEPADSPVKAVANETKPSQFVRMLLLPAEYENRSSFTLAGSADADKPRLQTNHRFFDKRIELVIS